MKHAVLFLFSIVLFLFAIPGAKAGFVVKKSLIAHTSSNTGAASVELAKLQTAENTGSAKLLHAPLDRWSSRGWVGIVSVICGVLGFIAPLFGFAALLLGFIGMNGKRNRHTGVAIVGFVLGLAVVLLVIFGGFAGWGIS